MSYNNTGAKSQVSQSILVELPKAKLPLVLRTALTSTGWRYLGGSDHLGKLSAEMHGTDERSGITFKDEFRLLVSWAEEGGQTRLNIALSDLRNYRNEIDCRGRLQAFIAELEENAAAFKSLGNPKPDPEVDDVDRFATLDDLEDSGLIDDPSDSSRFSLGTFEGQSISLPAEQAQMHTLVCGPTRSGKTSGIFIPNLIDRINMSAIVTEATAGDEHPDLYFKTAGWRAKHGHKIYYFNPDDLRSDRVNPLDQIELTGQTGRQVASVVNLLMRTTQQSAHHGDQFWTDCERYLLRSLVWHAVGMRESGNGHLGYICALLTLPQEELEDVMAASRMIKARNDFMSFMSKGSEDTRNIVMQGLLQRLDLWTEPMTVELTRTTDIDIKLLPEELFTFYIAMPAHKEELQPLATLLFNWIVQIALTAEFKHPITLLLDEFTNFGFVSAMDKKLTTIGHRKIPMVMGIQDSVQLQIVYKEFAAVFKTQPGTQIFFKPRDGELAGRIADDLGKKTVIDWDTRGADVIPRKISRLLHSKQDLRALRGECIVFLPDCQPAKMKYRHWSEYKESTSIPPPERRLLEVPHTSLFVDEADSGSLDYHSNQLLAQVQALAQQLIATHSQALALLEAGETEEAERLFARAKTESSLLQEAKVLLTKSNLAPRPQRQQKGRWVGNMDGRPPKKNSRRPE